MQSTIATLAIVIAITVAITVMAGLPVEKITAIGSVITTIGLLLRTGNKGDDQDPPRP